jgi:hypothetical protein
MLVCESMDACTSVCTVAKSSTHRSSHLIPSVEFSPTNSLEGEGKLLIHSSPFEQVHIVYMSVTKLSLVERHILLHLHGATDGNVITVRGHRNVIVCKTADWPPSLMWWRHKGWRSCGVLWSITGAWARARLDGPNENARFTPPINFFILHSTCNNNTQQQVPSSLGVSISVSWMGGRKQRVV